MSAGIIVGGAILIAAVVIYFLFFAGGILDSIEGTYEFTLGMNSPEEVAITRDANGSKKWKINGSQGIVHMKHHGETDEGVPIFILDMGGAGRKAALYDDSDGVTLSSEPGKQFAFTYKKI